MKTTTANNPTTARRRKRELTPRELRPACGARTKAGPCPKPAEWDVYRDRPLNGRCAGHGGRSTGAFEPYRGGSRARSAEG